MDNILSGLTWAKGLESQDGAAQVVDVNAVKSHIDVDDVEQNVGDVSESEPDAIGDGGDHVKAETNHDIISAETIEVASAISGQEGGKVIIAEAVDPISGAPKRFVISGFNAQTNPAAEPGDNLLSLVILLQNGIIPEVGVNGVTCEDLLKVVEEVFTCFQEGKFACEENDQVLQGVRMAQAAIAQRLARREAQGTEGTYQGN